MLFLEIRTYSPYKPTPSSFLYQLILDNLDLCIRKMNLAYEAANFAEVWASYSFFMNLIVKDIYFHCGVMDGLDDDVAEFLNLKV